MSDREKVSRKYSANNNKVRRKKSLYFCCVNIFISKRQEKTITRAVPASLTMQTKKGKLK